MTSQSSQVTSLREEADELHKKQENETDIFKRLEILETEWEVLTELDYQTRD